MRTSTRINNLRSEMFKVRSAYIQAVTDGLKRTGELRVVGADFDKELGYPEGILLYVSDSHNNLVDCVYDRIRVNEESDIEVHICYYADCTDDEWQMASEMTFDAFAAITDAIQWPDPDYAACVKAVDLGLPSGTLWADMNVGATKPEEYGMYFAWGETEGYEDGDGHDFSWEEYDKSPAHEIDTDLDLEHDAARANLGAPWQMPSTEQFVELRDYCDWKWTTQDGVNGYLVTSKANGNHIFLPASGYGTGASRNNRGAYGYYWSSTWYSARYARYLNFNSSGVGPQNYYYRYYGFAVRAVQNFSQQ